MERNFRTAQVAVTESGKALHHRRLVAEDMHAFGILHPRVDLRDARPGGGQPGVVVVERILGPEQAGVIGRAENRKVPDRGTLGLRHVKEKDADHPERHENCRPCSSLHDVSLRICVALRFRTPDGTRDARIKLSAHW